MQLRFIASASTSALHAAEAIARSRPIVDARLSVPLAEPAVALDRTIRESGLAAARLWHQLIGSAHQVDANRGLAATAIRKLAAWDASQEALAGRLADRIGSVEAAFTRAVPGVLDELQNRARPLREQWEARGPGMLAAIRRRTEPELVAESAEVVLVLPALGGDGVAHLANNSVRIEAVLTNNVPQLPEVVRLAWLLAQLQCDLPKHSEGIAPDRLPQLAAIALLPATLEAAEDVELVTLTPQLLSTVVAAWNIALPPGAAIDSVETWWQTYCATRPSWRTALLALEQMLFAPPTPG